MPPVLSARAAAPLQDHNKQPPKCCGGAFSTEANTAAATEKAFDPALKHAPHAAIYQSQAYQHARQHLLRQGQPGSTPTNGQPQSSLPRCATCPNPSAMKPFSAANTAAEAFAQACAAAHMQKQQNAQPNHSQQQPRAQPPPPPPPKPAATADASAPSFYKVLKVSSTATTEDIKKSFHKLALIHHPDKNNGDDEMFKKIKEAYETLSDPELRRKYDATLCPVRPNVAAAPRAANPTPCGPAMGVPVVAHPQHAGAPNFANYQACFANGNVNSMSYMASFPSQVPPHVAQNWSTGNKSARSCAPSSTGTPKKPTGVFPTPNVPVNPTKTPTTSSQPASKPTPVPVPTPLSTTNSAFPPRSAYRPTSIKISTTSSSTSNKAPAAHWPPSRSGCTTPRAGATSKDEKKPSTPSASSALPRTKSMSEIPVAKDEDGEGKKTNKKASDAVSAEGVVLTEEDLICDSPRAEATGAAGTDKETSAKKSSKGKKTEQDGDDTGGGELVKSKKSKSFTFGLKSFMKRFASSSPSEELSSASGRAAPQPSTPAASKKPTVSNTEKISNPQEEAAEVAYSTKEAHFI